VCLCAHAFLHAAPLVIQQLAAAAVMMIDMTHQISDMTHQISDMTHQMSDMTHQMSDMTHQMSDMTHQLHKRFGA